MSWGGAAKRDEDISVLNEVGGLLIGYCNGRYSDRSNPEFCKGSFD